jgi:hypothetical protein
VYFNDLWGLDLASLLLGTRQADGAPVGWVELLPNNASGSMIPARSSFSWDAVGGSAFVFGGSECLLEEGCSCQKRASVVEGP